jgi:hypothetical protein
MKTNVNPLTEKTMKIFGYSERGAMNALFYGMALDKEHGEGSMKTFIKDLAKIEGNFTEFELFNEFSLSDFGDPDMMIKAKNEKGQNVVFFIEAKASCCKYYNLQDQKTHHEDYMNGCDKYDKGHASNLYFQLRLKNYFFRLLPYFYDGSLEQKQQSMAIENDPKLRLKQKSKDGNRKIGKNIVVEKMVNKLKDCTQAFYIAIIPKQNTIVNLDTKSEYGFETYTITWEEIYSKFKNYVGETIEFNQNKERTKSQILNEPV